jgi:hypothetical protein
MASQRGLWWSGVVWVGALAACTSGTSTDPVDTEAGETDSDPVADTEDTEEPFIPCDQRGPVVFEIGTGESAFEPLVPGQEVALVRGAQVPPGYHIWGAVQVENVSQFVTIRYAVTDVPTGIVMGDFNFNVALVPPVRTEPWDCHGQYLRMTGVANEWRAVAAAAGMPETATIAEVLCGTDLRLDYALSVDGHQLASDSVVIKVQPFPEEAPPCETPSR